jgi:hypothetical protein
MKDQQRQAVADGVYVVLLSTTNENGKVRKTIEQVIVWHKSEEQAMKPRSTTQAMNSADAPAPAAVQDSSGTTGRITKWIATDTLGDSVITEGDGGRIGITSVTPTAILHVDAGQPRVSLANGTDAGTLIQTSGGKGGDANGSNTGGKGADISLLAGNGGDAPLGTSGDGGNVTIQAGSPGSGANTGVSGRVLIAPFVGRVGIGTVSPTEKLTVDGNVQIAGNGNGLKFPDSTVQTTAALTAVTTNATLTGDGSGGAPLGVADQAIDTAQLKDAAVTGLKIAPAQVVKSINTLKDNVTLAAGDNITITPGGQTLTIAATSQGINSVSHNGTLSGDGTTGTPLELSIPLSLSGSDPGPILTVNNGSGGTAITTLGAINTIAHYSIGGNRVLSVAGLSNVFGGANAGVSNTNRNSNSFFGASAGQSNTTGNFNSFVGNMAGQANTTGTGNSFFGSNAGLSNTTGGANAFFGTSAGQSTTTGNRNAFFGGGAGFTNTTGEDDAFFGYHAGLSNNGNSNSFFGSSAGQANTNGVRNSFFGSNTGHSNTTGGFNSFFGGNAGLSNTIGGSNSFFGANAGESNTTGEQNSFFGRDAGQANTTGNLNSFFGGLAGEHTTSFNNSFFGALAGRFNTTGLSNSFFGEEAGLSNTTGSVNSFYGNFAGGNNSTGNHNSFFGQGAGDANTSGSHNTFIGALSDGTANLDNATAIGYRAKVEQNNSLVLGSINGVNGANATVKVGIGTTEPQARLQVNQGDIYVGSPGQGIILKSPNGATCRKMTINNAGNPVSTAVPCP